MIHANSPFKPDAVDLDLTIRCGLEFAYQASAVTPMFLLIKPRLDTWQYIEKEQLIFDPKVSSLEYEDQHGNIVQRVNLRQRGLEVSERFLRQWFARPHVARFQSLDVGARRDPLQALRRRRRVFQSSAINDQKTAIRTEKTTSNTQLRWIASRRPTSNAQRR